MGWFRDHFTSDGRAARAVRRWESLAERSGALERFTETPPDWQPSLSALLTFGGITPVSVSLTGPISTLVTASAWSYVAITAVARQCAQLPPVVQRRGTGEDEGEWVPDRTHPLNRLIRSPSGPANARPRWSWEQLIQEIVTHLECARVGCVMRIVRSGGDPIALFPLSPNSVDVQADPVTSLPTLYRYFGAQYQPDDVCHITLCYPDGYNRSLPPMEAALRAVKIDCVAEERQSANLTNKIAPGMIIRVSGLMSMSQEKRRATLEEIKADVGLSTQDGSTLVGGDGWELVAPPLTIDQLGYSPTRLDARRQVLAVHGVPEMLVTTTDRPTYASVVEARKILWDMTCFPMLGTIYGQLNRQLVAPQYGEDVRLWYDLSGSQIALALLADRADVAQKLVTLGYPANAAAARAGLDMPWFEALDEPNVAQKIAGRTSPAETPPPDTEDDPEEDMTDEG